MKSEYRIFGPPGCGKTTYLCKQVRHAVDKHGPEALLLASFTKTAAAELAGRNLPIEPHRIGTLHAHCYRALGNPVVAESKIKDFNSDQKDYSLSPQGSVDMDESATDQSYSEEDDALFNEYQILRARMVPQEKWPLSVQGFAKKWSDWKSENGYRDFTDMITMAKDLMIEPPYGAKIGVFDEVQDFTPLQLALLRKWGEKFEIMLLAGDDDQTLYSFTGATPNAFLHPDLPEGQKRILDQSYRVPKAVQKFAQKLIEKVKNREPKEYKPRDVDGELRFLNSTTFKRPENMFEDMQQYLDEGKEVMILASCGYMLNKTVTKLREEGIMYHNPYRHNKGQWNPIKSGKGSTKQRLTSFLNPTGPEHGDKKLWSPTELVSWLDLVSVTGVLKRGAKQRLTNFAAQGEDYAKQEYFRLLLESFEESALNKAIALDNKFIMANAQKKRIKSLEFINSIIHRSGIETLNKKPQISIGTIHSVKGGQADVVYLFPDLSMNGQRAYNKYGGEEWESIIRQFYVGATRCKESLIICAPSGSWFVDEMLI